MGEWVIRSALVERKFMSPMYNFPGEPATDVTALTIASFGRPAETIF